MRGSAKACSGKCKAVACAQTARVWVIAACEGMVLLMERSANAELSLLPAEGEQVFTSLGAFQNYLEQATQERAYERLIVVGSTSDIAWVHSAMPSQAFSRVAAEVAYPLLPSWFKQPHLMPQLTRALQGALS